MRNIIKSINIIFLFIVCLLVSGIQINAQAVLDPNAEVEEIASGILQPEGPVWVDGIGLLFSDIQGNKIYKWTQENGKEVYIDPSDSTNGLTLDEQGRLVAGQMGLRRIVRFETDGTQTSLADKYQGKKFNSPNDLVVKSDGSIFFTDPDFNIPGGPQNKQLSFNGIYRISPTGTLQLLETLTLPNGICFSLDEKKLYVNDSQAHTIYVWDIVDDSTLVNKKLFYTIPVSFGYADGMKIDGAGNIYCTCSSAVWVISPTAELLGKINLPANNSASNCAWGDADRGTLFITAGKSVYKIRPLATNIKKEGSLVPPQFKLFQNYPNPFNPSTEISYKIPEFSQVTLKIFDILGMEVSTLVDEYQEPGTYNVLFDRESTTEHVQLSSGIYLVQLKAGTHSETKKMILLR